MSWRLEAGGAGCLSSCGAVVLGGCGFVGSSRVRRFVGGWLRGAPVLLLLLLPSSAVSSCSGVGGRLRVSELYALYLASGERIVIGRSPVVAVLSSGYGAAGNEASESAARRSSMPSSSCLQLAVGIFPRDVGFSVRRAVFGMAGCDAGFIFARRVDMPSHLRV